MECSGFGELAAVGVEAKRLDGGLQITTPVLSASGAGVTVRSRGAHWRAAAAVFRASRMFQTARSSSRVFMTIPEDHVYFPSAPERSKARRSFAEHLKNEEKNGDEYMPQSAVAPC